MMPNVLGVEKENIKRNHVFMLPECSLKESCQNSALRIKIFPKIPLLGKNSK